MSSETSFKLLGKTSCIEILHGVLRNLSKLRVDLVENNFRRTLELLGVFAAGLTGYHAIGIGYPLAFCSFVHRV